MPSRFVSTLLLTLILAASFLLKLNHLGHVSIKALDESFHALVAKNLIKRPLTPTLYDRPWLKNTWLYRLYCWLPDDTYVDIIAYLLKVNGFPAGSSELTLAKLDAVQILGKKGAEPPPNFALVLSVGCLVQDARGRWILDGASSPVRATMPGCSCFTPRAGWRWGWCSAGSCAACGGG